MNCICNVVTDKCSRSSRCLPVNGSAHHCYYRHAVLVSTSYKLPNTFGEINRWRREHNHLVFIAATVSSWEFHEPYSGHLSIVFIYGSVRGELFTGVLLD